MDVVHSELLGRVVETWRRALAERPEAREWLAARGISSGLADRFRVGWSAGLLGTLARGDVLDRLKRLGILDGDGRERFAGCVVVPVLDGDGAVVQVAATAADGRLDWLFPEETPAFWNADVLKHAPAVAVVADPLAGLVELAGGREAVIAPGGPGVPLGPGSRDALLAHAPRLDLRAAPVGLRTEIEKLGLPIEGEKPPARAEFIEQDASGFTLEFPRRLRIVVQGLHQDSPRHLRASLKVLRKPPENGATSERPRIHLDTFDLYHARSRSGFAKTAACVLGEDPTVLEEHLARVISVAEEFLGARDQPLPVRVLSAGEEEKARALLRDPAFPERVAQDLGRLGFVGEDLNKQVVYLASLSRKLEDPLSILVLSRSAAGKSTLAEAVAALAPPEDVLRFTRLTAQTLYYQKPDALAHKLVLVEEAEGVEDAAYALRILQSARKLSLSTASGRGDARTREVKGPVSLFVTTTRTDLDEETAGRFVTVAVDESREQTRAILEAQRRAEAAPPGGREAVLKLHQDAQRLLAPVPIVNPFAPQLTYPDFRLSARRDHRKYLGLIRAVAFARQEQRKREDDAVVVSLDDLALANRLAHHALGHSLYDLAPPSRRLLVEIREWLSERSAGEGLPIVGIAFTRRELRDRTGWKRTQLEEYLRELIASEYVLPLAPRGQGRRETYRLDWDGKGMDGERLYSGLIDVAALAGDLPGTCRGASDKQERAPKGGKKARKGKSGGTCRLAGEKGTP
jgi:hypothetical protein